MIAPRNEKDKNGKLKSLTEIAAETPVKTAAATAFSVLKPGTLVKAKDRDNYGTVVAQNGDQVTVSFKSKAGDTAEKTFHRSGLVGQTAVGDMVGVQPPSDLESVAADLPKHPGRMPSDLRDVPGFVGEWYEHLKKTAIRPQDDLNFAGALSLMATLVGRGVCDSLSNRTNLYMVGICRTGKGKDHAMAQASNLLDRVKPETAFNEVSSGAGLARGLEGNPNRLWLVDELGEYLAMIAAKNAPPHLKDIVQTLLKLYSSAGKNFSKEYSDSKKSVHVRQPCFNVYGATTPDVFYGSLTPGDISTGLIPRFLCFVGEDSPLSEERLINLPDQSIPDELIEEAQAVCRAVTEGFSQCSSTPAKPVCFEHSGEARELWAKYMVKCSKRDNDIWTRAAEKACRLALVRACSRDVHGREVNAEDMEWAISLVEWNTRLVIHQTSQHLAENEVHRERIKMVEVIRKLGLKLKGPVPRSLISRHSQWLRKRDRDECLADLVEAGLVRHSDDTSHTSQGAERVVSYFEVVH